MDKTAYNACVAKGLKGKTNLSKEERQSLFCEISKLCSGKARTGEEAKHLCSLPKDPKPPRKSRKGITIDSNALAVCVIKSLDGSEITQANLTSIIASCTGQKILTRESFIKKCFKENSFTGDIKEAEKLRSRCTAKWKAQYEER